MLSGISDIEVLERYPRTAVDHDNKYFYQGLLERKLLVNRCNACGRWHQPPRPICPSCWSRDITATEVSGEGVIHLLIFLHQGPPAAGVDYATPHPVAVVELAEQEGLRFSTTIVNADRETLRIGLPVTLTWIERDGNPFPAFAPAAA
ncbi:Zn-ribbon domain-containing OB-fold protein [Frankia sp. CiP3]|uniref:Zn-ribbon domain-containing OB-fold protein n=1 Tax=Frankia sp. CiP3 TaxID=2880971 RepID=UPI0035AEC814